MLGRTQVRVRQRVSPSSLSVRGASERGGVSRAEAVEYLGVGDRRMNQEGTPWVEDFFTSRCSVRTRSSLASKLVDRFFLSYLLSLYINLHSATEMNLSLSVSHPR